ncbi:DNA-binding transcriptional LysR family regulator [Pseudorhizobium tarimense]|uniref:DNA-binding transcriptional LysR family regulator n=1 Tax=Pseudorhizobium tarimense TaxID=1079109 RepID=A0ABV2HD94_9HYPH|nr:LysR family transcriptional regulator [Pseudorhizobium tarimense]MCJ8521175.1 LysR family transcriptional regulator [Pseudorhizobium tarimense]
MLDYVQQRLQWNDLSLILAVARSGSFAGAAVRLGVSTPTVFRHAKAVEQRLDTLIFHRDTTGVSLTAAGREAAALAERFDEEIGALEARVRNEISDAAGTVRLATVDTLIAGPLMPLIQRFRAEHSAILLDLRSGIGMANLRQREVDAALRAGGEPPESLVGRKLCRIAVSVYRSNMAEGVSSVQPWVVPNAELGHLASVRWLKQAGRYADAALQANSLYTLAEAVANGLGQGILPCYLADADPRLTRVGEPIDELSSDLWFLTHSELRHTGRIRALSDFLAREFHALRPLFGGAYPERQQ